MTNQCQKTAIELAIESNRLVNSWYWRHGKVPKGKIREEIAAHVMYNLLNSIRNYEMYECPIPNETEWERAKDILDEEVFDLRSIKKRPKKASEVATIFNSVVKAAKR